MQLLDGIRVLDFGRFIAGPFCAALLGDHGADVIRIERPEGGEDRYTAPVAPGAEGGTFLQCNRNKRGLAIDPGHPEAREIIRALLREADVVVANLPPATLAKMGLDYPTLSALNPRAILTVATAYGPVGPYSERPGFDTVGQAMSGAMFMSGMPDAPVRASVNYVDFTTGLSCAFGTMGALWARERTGRGQLVQASLLRSSLMLANNMLIEQAVRKVDRVPQGNRGFIGAPMDTYRTRTGWLMLQVIGTPMFERWCRLVGRPELASDPRFADDEQRGIHSAEISGIMAEWCAQRDLDAALDALNRVKLPAAPVLSPQQALDDPHVQASGMLQPIDYALVPKPYPLVQHPVDLSDWPAGFRRPPPRVGEHSREVLAALGLADARIDALIAQGVVVQAQPR